MVHDVFSAKKLKDSPYISCNAKTRPRCFQYKNINAIIISQIHTHTWNCHVNGELI